VIFAPMLTLDEPLDCLEALHRLNALHADVLGDEKHGVDPGVILVCLSGSIPGCAVSAALHTVVGNAHLHLWTHCLVIDNSTGQWYSTIERISWFGVATAAAEV
jgi:hypothetical protein